MTKFADSIERNWPDYVIVPGASKRDCCLPSITDDVSDETLQSYDEGSFSWQECDSCGSTLGGQRYPAHAINKAKFGVKEEKPGDIYHIEICVDCLMFHANGEEPGNWES